MKILEIFKESENILTDNLKIQPERPIISLYESDVSQDFQPNISQKIIHNYKFEKLPWHITVFVGDTILYNNTPFIVAKISKESFVIVNESERLVVNKTDKNLKPQ